MCSYVCAYSSRWRVGGKTSISLGRAFWSPQYRQLSGTAMGRLRIALLPLALVLVLVNLPSSSSAPQPQVLEGEILGYELVSYSYSPFGKNILLTPSPSTCQPQPGLGFLSDLWDIEVDLWRQAYANVQAERRAERRQARY